MPNAMVSDKFGHAQLENHRTHGNRNIFLANVNGVQIASTLNPYAVEFYPMHVRQQLQNRGDFNFERQAQRQQQQQQLQAQQNEERRQQQQQQPHHHLEPQKEVTNEQTCPAVNENTHLKEQQTDKPREEANFEKPEVLENEPTAKLQINIEDISECLINDIKEEIGYFQLPQKSMKIVEIVSIEEITDESISKPDLNADKNTTKNITPSNESPNAARHLFFGSEVEFESNTNDEEESKSIRNSKKLPTDHETIKSADLKSTNEELKCTKTIEDVGDHNHNYESDSDILPQINKVSRSQTDIKPRMNVEILDGKAPPTTPRNDVYLHGQLIVKKKLKPSSTPKNTRQNATAGGIRIRKLPERTTTSRDPTVSSTIKERPKLTSTNKIKPLWESKRMESNRQKLPDASTTTNRSTSRIKPTSDFIKNQKIPTITISRSVTPSVARSSVSQKSLKTTTDCKNSSNLKIRDPAIRTSHSSASTSIRKATNSAQSK